MIALQIAKAGIWFRVERKTTINIISPEQSRRWPRAMMIAALAMLVVSSRAFDLQGPQVRTAPAAIPFIVIIDAAHGGNDSGAHLSDKLAEKDITLTMARKLRTELLDRDITAVLLRDNDISLTNDKRAVTTNGQRAGIYISIHAALPGAGVRVYTAMLPAHDETAPEQAGPFVPWETAQSDHLERSQTLASALVTELKNAKIAAVTTAAPLLPLREIAAPAIAIEVAPPRPNLPAETITAAKYQQAIASATAAAIAAVRAKIEAHP